MFQGRRNSWDAENGVVTVNTLYLWYDMQSVRAVQGCMAVLCEPAKWRYNLYIKNIISRVKFIQVSS